MRRLALHGSALSDDEYDLYTSSLRDIALADEDELDSRGTTKVNGGTGDDDAYFERITIGVREARAWLRGRYSHMSASVIDSILRLFAPNLGHGGTLSGSEFFAVLRLVIHAESGKPVDRSLAFVQANPSSSSSARTLPEVNGSVATDSVRAGSQIKLTTSSTSQKSSPAKRIAELPPPMPSRKPNTATSTGTPDINTGNPFSMPTNHVHPQPPLHPSQRSESSKSLSQQQHSPYNPFVINKKPTPPTKSDDGLTKLPPLPPRKPPPPIPSSSAQNVPPPPPPRHVSRTRQDRSQSPTKHLPTPPPTAKLPQHVTSNLMKQSLQASKVAQSMKRAEEQLEKERVMQVLKSSSVVSGSYSLAGASVTSSSVVIGTNIHHQYQQHPSGSSRRSPSPTPARPTKMYAGSSSVSSASTDERAPPLPRRRIHHQPSRSTVSNSSMEQVALAGAPGPGRTSTTSNPESYALSPFRSPVEPVLANTDSPEHSPSRRSFGDRSNGPPPTHPDRKPHLPFQSPTSFPVSSKDDNLQAFDAIYGPSAPSPTSTPPFGRVFRSKSLHQQSPPLPPLQPPPIRRRRPESVQVLGNGEVLVGSLSRREETTTTSTISSTTRSPLSRNATISTPGHHRRSSLSVSSTPPFSDEAAHEKPLSNIQRTIANLQPKLEGLNMNLDKARYKAEAGLSKRGFVRDSVRSKTGVEGEEEEGLMRLSGRGRASSIGRKLWGVPVNSSETAVQKNQKGVFDDPEVDDDSLDDWQRHGRGSSSRASRPRKNLFDSSEESLRISPEPVDDLNSADNLKWPAGEGWKPL